MGVCRETCKGLEEVTQFVSEDLQPELETSQPKTLDLGPPPSENHQLPRASLVPQTGNNLDLFLTRKGIPIH